MVTAVVESPRRQQQRLWSALAGSSGGGGDFEFHHWRPVRAVTMKRASSVSSGMRGRRAPPELEIPYGLGRGYTSLRDLMSSPDYAKGASPDEVPGSGCGGIDVGGDVHMIRHPLVKHAAYAYLQLTPSAREEARRRAQRRRRPLCRLFLGCLGFLGALFGR